MEREELIKLKVVVDEIDHLNNSVDNLRKSVADLLNLLKCDLDDITCESCRYANNEERQCVYYIDCKSSFDYTQGFCYKYEEKN